MQAKVCRERFMAASSILVMRRRPRTGAWSSLSCTTLIREGKGRRGSSGPIRAPFTGRLECRDFRPIATASIPYRCRETLRVVNAWLRERGVEAEEVRGNPLHRLRKQFGSEVATGFGLFAAQKPLGCSSPAVTSKYYAAQTELSDASRRVRAERGARVTIRRRREVKLDCVLARILLGTASVAEAQADTIKR